MTEKMTWEVFLARLGRSDGFPAPAVLAQRADVPMSTLRGWLTARSLPPGPEQAERLIRSMISFLPSESEEEVEEKVELGLTLWSEAMPEPPRDGAAPPPDEVAEIAVQVATYLGVAGVGGILGNRADAMVTTIFRWVGDRWRRRTSDEEAPLNEEEAVAAAIAAASAGLQGTQAFAVENALLLGDGSWRVILRGTPALLVRVRVPPGDPANATILLLPSSWSDSRRMRS